MKTRNNAKGFTLIELLIVIAILGVLAIVILLALNPVQQLARARDAGRISTVTQLGHALEAYGTNHSSLYVPNSTTWIDTLQTAGEISQVPAAVTYAVNTTQCTNGGAGSNQNGYCYNYVAPNAVVYTTLESDAHNARCTAPARAYAAYSTQQGRGGIVCASTGAALSPTGINFIQ